MRRRGVKPGPLSPFDEDVALAEAANDREDRGVTQETVVMAGSIVVDVVDSYGQSTVVDPAHRHVPASFVEFTYSNGVRYSVYDCECGTRLPARRG